MSPSSVPSGVVAPANLDDAQMAYYNMARSGLEQICPPEQSMFRVYCVLVYVDADGVESHVVGTNDEIGDLGGALCAERAAVVQLRHLQGPWQIKELYISSDSEKHITPGLLCREYLRSKAAAETPVYMVDEAGPQVATLGQLYPYFSAYGKTPRSQVVKFAEDLAEKQKAQWEVSGLSKEELSLIESVRAATCRDSRDGLHPMRYAAGALMTDGSIISAWQKKGIEYGCTLDAVAQLAPKLEDAREEQKLVPRMLVQVDQFGVLHAPFARGRAFLAEHGFADVQVLVTQAEGVVIRTTVDELVPCCPQIFE